MRGKREMFCPEVIAAVCGNKCPLINTKDRVWKEAAGSRDTEPWQLGENLKAQRTVGIEPDNIASSAQDLHDTVYSTGIDTVGVDAQFAQGPDGVYIATLDQNADTVANPLSTAPPLARRTVACLSNIAAGQCVPR